jgi:prephenate dehydratase
MQSPVGSAAGHDQLLIVDEAQLVQEVYAPVHHCLSGIQQLVHNSIQPTDLCATHTAAYQCGAIISVAQHRACDCGQTAVLVLHVS